MKYIILGDTHQDALKQYNEWVKQNPNVYVLYIDGNIIWDKKFEYFIRYTITKPNIFYKILMFVRFLRRPMF